MRKIWAAPAALTVSAAALGCYAWNKTTYASRDRRAVHVAGFRENRAVLPSGTELNYVEGPDNGPALLLLHGQGGAWESYARALPGLSRDFHVYAIDFAGHGASARTPGRYDIHHLGQDVIDFITAVIGAPVILSGHSSGGLVAAWVAATSDQVRAWFSRTRRSSPPTLTAWPSSSTTSISRARRTIISSRMW